MQPPCAAALLIRLLQVVEDRADVIRPLIGRLSHPEVDLRGLFQVPVAGLLRDLHGSVEVLRRGVEVALLGQELAQLEVGPRLALAVLELVGELEVALHEHLHLVLVQHRRLHVLPADLAQVPDGHGLPGNRAHLDGVAEGKVMIDGGFLVIAHVVVDDAEVDVGEELAGNVRDLLVLVVKLDGVLVEVGLVGLPELHVVHADAVVGEGLTVDVPDGLADLEELLVLLYSLLVLAQIVKEDSRGVVGAALITGFARTFASESQNVVVL